MYFTAKDVLKDAEILAEKNPDGRGDLVEHALVGLGVEQSDLGKIVAKYVVDMHMDKTSLMRLADIQLKCEEGLSWGEAV